MARIESNDSPYLGAARRSPTCTRCGTPLCGRLEEVRRESGHKLFVWLCGCGRRRQLRREVEVAAR